MNCGFIAVDDADFVTENPWVQKGLTQESMRWAFSNLQTTQWIPLTWLSLMADHELNGLDPGPYHRTNVLIHLASVCLLFFLVVRTTGLFWPSLLAALFFGVHPLRVESVVWIAERKDVLCTFFYLLAIGAYAWYVRQPSLRRYGPVAACFVLALMSKAMAMSLPLALLAFDWWPLRRIRSGAPNVPEFARSSGPERISWTHAFLEKAPLFALSAAFGLLNFFGGKDAVIGSAQQVPYLHRIAVALQAYLHYLGDTIWPSHLSIQYFYPLKDIPAVPTMAAVATVAVISAAAWRWRDRAPWLSAGWTWYILTLLPVIGLLQFGRQARADRYTYIPSVGIAMIAAFGLQWLACRWRSPAWIFPASAVMAGLAFASQTVVQVGYWKDSETLFHRAIAVNEKNADAYSWLGVALAEQRRFDEALAMYRQAIDYYPNAADYFNGLGSVLAQMGRPSEAEAALQRALTLDPRNIEALNNLGIVKAQQGDTQAAGMLFNKARALKPDHYKSLVNLANLAVMQADYREAERLYLEALQLHPNLAAATAGLNRLRKAGLAH